MAKLKASDIAEIGKYFHPSAQVVTSLPNPATMEGKDLGEVLKQNSDGTYTKYQIIKGAWHSAGTLTKV